MITRSPLTSRTHRPLVIPEFVIIHGRQFSLVGATHASPIQKGLPRDPKPHSLGAVVGSFKSAVTKRINIHRNTPGVPVWHRNYYEHIVRDDFEMNRVREYIAGNPAQWLEDEENPDRQS
jgi:hypothetical protein